MNIHELLRESLELHYDKSIIYKTVKEHFKHTSLGSSKKFLNESVNLLISNDVDKFYYNLFETAEMKAALLNICVLTFSTENSKLGGSVVTFSLPAGWSCPFAKACLKKVNRERSVDPEKVGTSKISKRTGEEVPYKGDVVVTKGKDSEFDCFAANQEMQYDALRANRWHNFDLLIEAGKEGGAEAQAELIIRSLEYFFDTEGSKNEVRIHESGDFYNNEYLKAWMLTAQRMPNIHFYAYSKSVPYVKAMENQLKDIPNFAITLSQGGTKDADIKNIDIKTSRVFETPEEILKAGLVLDLDDNLAKEMGGREKDFALLVHGTQAAGEMSKNKMRNETFMAYWKYRKQLNRALGLNVNSRITNEQGQQGIKYIDEILSNPTKDSDITNLKFIKKLINYGVKYNKYGFNENLIKILPEKYRP
jgi:hypothetical protein